MRREGGAGHPWGPSHLRVSSSSLPSGVIQVFKYISFKVEVWGGLGGQSPQELKKGRGYEAGATAHTLSAGENHILIGKT